MNQPFVFDPETDVVISLIARIREKASRFLARELKAYGLEALSPIHGDILMALFSHGEMTMGEIAKVVDRRKSTVTTLIEKLLRLGYARKTKDPEDNRAYRIGLTTAGRELKTPLIDISRRLIETVYRDIPKAQQLRIVGDLRILNDNLR